MTTAHNSSKARLARLCASGLDERGMAAVEFAMIMPFILTVYLGGIELGDGLAIGVKVTNTAHILADLTTQQTSINDATMTAILGASTATIAPYSSAYVVATVSEVSTDASGNATVTWSDSLNGTRRPVGQVIHLPTSLAGQANISLILGEVSYNYTPTLGYFITGAVTISDSYYLYPRLGSSIARS